MSELPRAPASGMVIHPGYVLVTLAYAAGIYWFSSRVDLGAGDTWRQLAVNLYHIPLYAGLGFCALQAVSGGRAGRNVPWTCWALTFVVTAMFAALDEWHQALVPGRSPSVGDFLLDLTGTAWILVVTRLAVSGSSR